MTEPTQEQKLMYALVQETEFKHDTWCFACKHVINLERVPEIRMDGVLCCEECRDLLSENNLPENALEIVHLRCLIENIFKKVIDVNQ